ncbi:MAG: carboxylesterase family protein [Planctomycetota bacterium]
MPTITMYGYLSILLLLSLLVPPSFCLGEGVDPKGRVLVGRYLASADADEREDILKAVEQLRVDCDRVIREWIELTADYTPVQPALYRKVISVGESKGEYFVYIPSSYTPDRSWPVVLALHGVGGRGLGQAMAWLKSSAHNDEFIFIAPPYGSGLWWEEAAEGFVMSVFDKAKTDYNIDTDRVYVTGFSSGGHGAWYLALRHPGLFAAINPIAGECPLPELLVNLMHVPVYIIHGTKDNVILVGAARDANSRLEKLDYDVVYKELPELRHKFPKSELGDVLDWFRGYRRTPDPGKVKFSTESTKYSMSYWIEITEFSGMVGKVAGIPKVVHGQLVMPDGVSETATVSAEIRENNEIYLHTREVRTLRLYLNDALINMGMPVHVYVNDKSVYSGRVNKSLRTLLDTARKRNDRRALFPAYIDLVVPSE